MKTTKLLLLTTLFCSGCIYGEAFTGYPLTEKSRIVDENKKQDTEMKKQQTEILVLYKDCLVRSQHDKSVDCSEFRTALQVIETKGP